MKRKYVRRAREDESVKQCEKTERKETEPENLRK